MKHCCSILLTIVILSLLVSSCNYLPHSIESAPSVCTHAWSEATCISPKTCSLCGKIEGDTLTHIFNTTDITEATCTKDGEKVYKCSLCGELKEEKITKSGHNYAEVLKNAATCTESGLKEYICSKCHDVKTESIAPIGHSYLASTTKKPSCVDSGIRTLTCSICKHSYTESIPAEGHSWNKASCSMPKTCRICNATEGSALGHTTDNGTCERCGRVYYQPIVYSGNGDQVIKNIVVPNGICKLIMTNTGKSNFIVKGYDKTGDGFGSYANEIGNYSGEIVFTDDLNGGFIEVQSSGKWELTFQTIETEETTKWNGKGDYVTPFFTLQDIIYCVSLMNDGSSNFIVHIYDEQGNSYSSLANEIGSYSGAVVFTPSEESVKYCLEVISSGKWSISFDKNIKNGTSNIKGFGDTVSPWFTLDRGALTVVLTNEGDSNFIVHLYDENGNSYSSLANEIGNYSGAVIFNKGDVNKKYCIEVISSGSWTVDFGLSDSLTDCR